MHMRPSDLLKAICRGVLVLVLFWLVAFALVQLGERVFGGWAPSAVGLMLACGVGVNLALRMRVKFLAYVLAGLFSFSASELVLRSIYGMQSVQGSGAHFAVMFAGLLGVLLGWSLSRHPVPRTPQESSVPSPSPSHAKEMPTQALASPAA